MPNTKTASYASVTTKANELVICHKEYLIMSLTNEELANFMKKLNDELDETSETVSFEKKIMAN